MYNYAKLNPTIMYNYKALFKTFLEKQESKKEIK